MGMDLNELLKKCFMTMLNCSLVFEIDSVF